MISHLPVDRSASYPLQREFEHAPSVVAKPRRRHLLTLSQKRPTLYRWLDHRWHEHSKKYYACIE